MNREEGATMVEFAIVSVVAFALVFGMLHIGLVVFGNSVGSGAARDGARVGLVNYEDADVPGSANNLAVVGAVKQRLAGVVVFRSATVVCRPADDLAAIEQCRPTSVDLSRGDLIEVSVAWDHKGAAAVAPATHTAMARMVIGGPPDLSTAPPTGTTSATATTSTTAPSTTSTTAPVSVTAAQMADRDHDGRVDQVLVTFSQALGGSCATGWTLSHVPSGGTLAGVSISSSTATLDIVEGPGARDTAVGAFTIAFAGCSGIPGFAGLVPSDTAGPVFVSLTDGGGIDGKPEPGDNLDLLFSEPLNPTWIPTAAITVTFDRHGSHEVDVSIPALVSSTTFGSGSAGYVTKNNKSVLFNNALLTATGATLHLNLGSACFGCENAGVGQGSFSFTPAGTIRDAGSYVSIAPITATNWKLF